MERVGERSSTGHLIAAAYGVELDLSALLPAPEAALEEVIEAAERIALALGEAGGLERGLPDAPRAAPGWAALPVRPGCASSASERAAAVERLRAWAEAAGARLDGVALHVGSDGEASVRAVRGIAVGEAIFEIPRSLMMIDDQVVATSGLSLGLTPHRPGDALAIWLSLESRIALSPWRPFLDTLPTQFPELPVFRSSDELAGLAGTAADALVAETRGELLETYARLPAELRAQISLADFAWGEAVVQTRGFNAPITLEERLALIPLADLLNHRPGDTTWHYDPATERFTISAARPFAAGEEVHFTYGNKGNAKLLADYGFALPANRANEALLIFAPAPSLGAAITEHLWWAFPLDAPLQILVTAEVDDRLRRGLSIARLRAWWAAPAEQRPPLSQAAWAGAEIPWLGASLEAAALAQLAAAARQGLAALPQEQAQEPTTAWARSCALARASEQEVLEELVAFAEAAIRALAPIGDPALRATSAPSDAIEPPRLARRYLQMLAAERPSG
jgi:SET domain